MIGGLFNYPFLMGIAKEQKGRYKHAEPFPHIIIDAPASSLHLMHCHHSWQIPGSEWFSYDNPLERKFANPNEFWMTEPVRETIHEMNSQGFVNFLETLTGISPLIVDPKLNGGGQHMIMRGGKLDVHEDYNFHKETGLHRRLNVLLYINPDWKEEWGGHLELWDKEMTLPVKKIAPKFNRMVIFSTIPGAHHGHPDPLNCPVNESRKSIAMYYYSTTRPKEEISENHSTIFRKRPNDPCDPEMDEIRKKRAIGRLKDLKETK